MAQAATGRGGRRREGTGSDSERWEVKGKHRLRQRYGEVEGTGSDREWWEAKGRHRQQQRELGEVGGKGKA